MHSYILQDWNTVAGASGAVITQEDTDWLDLEPFQDVVMYLECRESTFVGSAPTIAFQTAPTKDDSLFSSLLLPTTTINLSASSTPQVISALLLSANVPLARFLRWQISGTGSTAPWDATFRVMVAANSPGM